MKNLEKVKSAIIEEFGFVEKRVSESWLDVMDIDPDPKNPAHWTHLLDSKKYNCFINLRFFPIITIEPKHTTSYTMGRIKYKNDMKTKHILKYIHNILDDDENTGE
jgi:hypothetical protein